MKTDEISELEVNDELIAMISGEFENTSDVAERPEWLSREHQLTSTSCWKLEEEERLEITSSDGGMSEGI